MLTDDVRFFNEVIEALSKQTAQEVKVRILEDGYKIDLFCPRCHNQVWLYNVGDNYCPDCGQKLKPSKIKMEDIIRNNNI